MFNRKRESILLTPADLSTEVSENKNDNDYSDSDYVPSLEDESFTSKSDSEMDSDMDDDENYDSFVEETSKDGERINEELDQDDETIMKLFGLIRISQPQRRMIFV